MAQDELIARLESRVAALEGKLSRSRANLGSREEFLLRTFEDAPIGMALVGLDERIEEANAALCSMLGYARDELLTKTVVEITHPDDCALEAHSKGELKEGSTMAFVIEKRYLRADGSVLTGRLTVSALLDDEAKPACYLGQLEDVTGEHEAKQALRASEARFRALVENTNDIFCILDPHRALQFASPSLTEQLGWRLAQVEARDFAELIAPEHQDSFGQAFADLLADPSSVVRLAVKLRSSEGNERYFDVVGQNRTSTESLGGVVLTLRDITEQRALQDKVYQAQRLDSIGRLAGGIAHDFNNMLSVILGAVHFLSRDPEVSARRAAEIAAIDDAATRARNLILQLRVIGARQPTFGGSTDAQAALASCAPLLRRILGDHIEFDCDLQAAPGQVAISETQFEQVIFNFATNAVDAMPHGGRFAVSTRSTVLPAGPHGLSPGRYLELEIVDSGVGIDPSIARQIFDPFFSTKETGKGTGLGLATVYGIVRQAGGDITVHSAPGQGARFVILLPEASGSAGREAVEPPKRSSARNSVLIVDDDASVLSIMTRILASEGFEVVTAGGPEAALEQVEGGADFDLLITDMIMPKMSGLELADRIVEHRGPVPVVFVSGFTNTDLATVLARGAFVAKPFAPEALIATVREQLRSPRE